jgi:hypothetical protein
MLVGDDSDVKYFTWSIVETNSFLIIQFDFENPQEISSNPIGFHSLHIATLETNVTILEE